MYISFLLNKLTNPKVQSERIITEITRNCRQLRGWRSELLPESYHPAKFSGYKSCEFGDVIFQFVTISRWSRDQKVMS